MIGLSATGATTRSSPAMRSLSVGNARSPCAGGCDPTQFTVRAPANTNARAFGGRTCKSISLVRPGHSGAASTLPPTQVGLARLAHCLMRNPGRPGFRGGEGRLPSHRDGGRGGGTTLAQCPWVTTLVLSKRCPPPSTSPRHALRARGEGSREASPAVVAKGSPRDLRCDRHRRHVHRPRG